MLSVSKLHQVLAASKAITTPAEAEVTNLFRQAQLPDLFNGLSRTYEPLKEDGETLPPESKRVQTKATDILSNLADQKTKVWDIRASIDATNMKAKADVVVGEVVLIKDAPVTLLLYLEKQLKDMKTFIEKMALLDTTVEWSKDPSTGLWKTGAVKTAKTAKIEQPLVLLEPTKEHPGKAEKQVVDKITGYWTLIKSSGALDIPTRTRILKRIETLYVAVKTAREEANSTEAEDKKIGQKLFSYLFDE